MAAKKGILLLMAQERLFNGIRIQKSWVTIGSFDGVHLGHQALLNNLVTNAHKNDASAVVITFDPHPAVYLKRIREPYYLTSPEERVELMRALDVDSVITLVFDENLAQVEAKDFTVALVEELGMQCLLCGKDFALGKNRAGTIETLRKLGRSLDFAIKINSGVFSGRERISSSRIRNCLLEGNVHKANKLLGRVFSVTGKVIQGDGRGKGLGIPTANLQIWDQQLLPMNGVYATKINIEGESFFSLTNIGRRPTFEFGFPEIRMETMILDFNREIYGKTISVFFYQFIRPEVRFENGGHLVAQIKKDIAATREFFQNAREKNISS